jgi:SAM-dependent methyltransferase
MKAYFDEFAEDYENKAGKFNPYFVKKKCKKVLQILERYSPTAPKCGLDLGCGNGFSESILTHHLQSIVGIDVSVKMIEVACNRRLKKTEFVVGETLELPFRRDTFDFTFNFGLIHHLNPNSWERLIEECARVVRNRGLIMTFDHNSYNPITKYIISQLEIDSNVEKLANAKEIEKIYDKVGLEILESRSIIFSPIEFLDNIFTDLFGRFKSLGGQFYIVGRVYKD